MDNGGRIVYAIGLHFATALDVVPYENFKRRKRKTLLSAIGRTIAYQLTLIFNFDFLPTVKSFID